MGQQTSNQFVSRQTSSAISFQEIKCENLKTRANFASPQLPTDADSDEDIGDGVSSELDPSVHSCVILQALYEITKDGGHNTR